MKKFCMYWPLMNQISPKTMKGSAPTIQAEALASDDMARLFAGFDLVAPNASVSMTMNAPAPIILAMYVAAAKRRFGPGCVGRLRGTIQADMLKEVQAQNEMLQVQNEAIQAIADGQIAATFTYDNAGKEACESAAKLIAGESIEPEWVLETNQIDETNAEEWVGQGF